MYALDVKRSKQFSLHSYHLRLYLLRRIRLYYPDLFPDGGRAVFFGKFLAATTTPPDDHEDHDEDCASGSYTNEDVSVLISHVSWTVAGREEKRHKYLVDPTLHRRRTEPVLARAVTPAWCTVQEVLLHREAGIRAKFGRLAGEDAVGVVARSGIVVGRDLTHNVLALTIARSALAAGTLEAIRAARSVGRNYVVWTYGIGPRAFLFRIAFSVALAAHCICRRKLTVHATILVRIASGAC